MTLRPGTRLHLIAFSLLCLGLSACSSVTGPIGNPELPYPLEDPAVGDLFHLPTGHKVEFDQMLEAIGDTRLVYIGETHDNPASHQLQLDVLQGLQLKNPDRLALGMEMFTPEQQPVLDRWVAGELDEKEFLLEVDWFTNWQMNFALYRPLLDFCRINRIPVIALNAPKPLVRQIGRTQLYELPEDVQQRLPELDFSDPYQRAMTEGIYSGHSMGKAMSDGFLRVQTLWDETMAQSIADYLSSENGSGRQMVVVAGGNHVRYGFGIPRRVHRRIHLSYLLIGSQEFEIPKDRHVQMMDVQIPQFPMRAWDYLRLTRYEKINSGVKMGIVIEDDPRGIQVQTVMPGSAADKAGIQKGDILTQVNGVELIERFDLLYLLMNMNSPAEVDVRLIRGAENLKINIKL